ncbi:DUF4041 domain-containing protein [Ruminococcus sp. 5_1_39BFAA]|uniref:DUF4041 domain-containing protein n=1 Tax=Ruminococcus sp. 5_1_39BFAA TaxID=457412 RepID=UPI003562DDB8
MKKKWYLQTWLICVLFAFWFLYGIPLLIGIVLLVLKSKDDKAIWARINELETESKDLKALLTPEMQDAHELQNLVSKLQNDENAIRDSISKLTAEKDCIISDKENEINKLDAKISERKKSLISFDDEILVQEFGLYKPQYDFASALDYKEALSKIRAEQKELIKNKQAVTGNTNWQVNGSASKGKKMVSDTQKLLLRAFNSECDELISKVKYTNFDASLNRIYKSSEAITKLGNTMNIAITQKYLDAKVKELRLAFEYQQKKQEEKEELKSARAEQREQARAQRELEEQKKKIEKEQTHYQTAYAKIQNQLLADPQNQDLLAKKAELENQLSDIDKALANIDYRQANAKAGYVYIISNIGAFGENIYKIGMTRRLDPQERVDELGDASVPFNFDVHAMIFSDNAPALESALHKAFENKKLNMVNQRREFFNVTLDEIKDIVKKNFDKTVEFIDVPDAEQYRISQRLRNNRIAL